MDTGTSIIMDEATVKLFMLFQQYREPFEIMVNSKMFELPKRQWKVSFNEHSVLTDILKLEEVVYRR